MKIKDSALEKTKSLMDTYFEIGQFNGSVLVSKGENIIYKNGYGLANKEWNTLNDTETKFRLGSITKQFTAAIILILVDEGKLSLNQKIIDILPDFNKNVGTKVSIHQLLSHTSGIAMPKLSFEEYNNIFQKKQSAEQLLEKLCNDDLAFEPGTKFSYSSAGYIVLGAIIEKITLITWEEALQQYILDPLKMNDTGIDDYEKILFKRASGYQTNYGLGNARFKYMPSSFSSGALYSTVEDMHKWFIGLCSDKLLSPKSKKLMFKKHTGSSPEFFGYSWFISDKECQDSLITLVSHAGDVNGFSSIIMGNPKTQELVILLTNQEGTHYYEIAENIFNIFNNVPTVKPKIYIADILRETIYKDGIEIALSRYEKIISEEIDNYNADINELIELGYDLIYIHKMAEAIEVLKIATQLHPENYNAFDSLGEAYYLNDMVDSALKNYKISFALNPNNKNASEMIQLLLKKAN